MRAQLIPIDGTAAIEVAKDLTLVGRREECDLRIPHKSVSKMHCVIVRTDGLLLLRDLGSTNGTRVNGQRVRRAVLKPDDQLTIAHFKFRVHLGPDAPVHAAPQLHASEHTQALDAREVAHLLKPGARAKVEEDDGDDSVELPAAPMQRNPLPDIYPDEFEPRR